MLRRRISVSCCVHYSIRNLVCTSVCVCVYLCFISFMMGHNGERKGPGASELTQIIARSCLGNWIGMRGKWCVIS